MKIQQQGMALITILIFLEIFTVLGLSIMQENLIESRTAYRYFQKYLLMNQAEEVLESVKNSFDSSVSTCVISSALSEKLFNSSLKFWRENACSGENDQLKYYYIFESLEDQVSENNQQSKMRAFRVILLAISKVDENMKIYLTLSLRAHNTVITRLRSA